MARQRWIYPGNGADPIRVDEDYVPPPRNSDAVLWNDRAYQDLNDPRFTSRSQHREYMRANGLATADDFTETWRAAERARLDAKRGVDPTRRADIARAIDQHNRRK